MGSSIRKCKWWAFKMAFKSCRRVGALSEIIVSNSFFTFCKSICTLIHKLTTIHQKAALLFNIHPCILMGYFSNNAADNNMSVCYIPCKIGDPESLAGKHAQTSYTTSLFHLCLHTTHTHFCFYIIVGLSIDFCCFYTELMWFSILSITPHKPFCISITSLFSMFIKPFSSWG